MYSPTFNESSHHYEVVIQGMYAVLVWLPSTAFHCPRPRKSDSTCWTGNLCHFSLRFFIFFDSSSLLDLNVFPELCYKTSTSFTFLWGSETELHVLMKWQESHGFYILMFMVEVADRISAICTLRGSKHSSNLISNKFDLEWMLKIVAIETFIGNFIQWLFCTERRYSKLH
jgi:hypothetical protein